VSVTAVQIIEEIKRLPRSEQAKVVSFARQNLPLSPAELGELARRMIEANDPAEADRIQEEIERGFYGPESHA